MKQLYPTTVLTEAATASRFRRFWLVDLLIALLLFWIALMLETAALTPVLLAWVFRSVGGFSGLAEAGTAWDAFSAVMNAMTRPPEWFTLLSLLMTGAVIGVVILYCVKLERRPIESIGFRGENPFGEIVLGYALGAGMLAAAWGICLAAGTATVEGVSPRLSWMVLPYFFAFLIQGLSEETLCRGFLMQTLSARYAGVVAVAVNSLLFAALHLLNAWLTPLALCNLFLFGVFASTYMWKRGSIWGVGALHAAWNFTQGNLLGIPVSGNDPMASVLNTSLASDAEALNGGPFGLEGGLAVTLVLLVGIGIALAMPVKRDARLSA